MKKITGISLIAIGSFLEVWYYMYRFTGDGLPLWLSLIIGIGLNIFLIGLVLNGKLIKGAPVWIIIIISFSIISTSAGQAMSLQEQEREIKTSTHSREIELLKQQRKMWENNYNKAVELLDRSVSDFDDMWEWRNTTQKYEDQRDEALEQIKAIDLKLVDKTQQKASSQSLTIYSFYLRLFSGETAGVAWFQFVLQTILSAIIAFMAPLGILLVMKKSKKQRRKKKHKPETKQQVKTDIDKIKKWIRINWIGIRRNKSKSILPKNIYKDYIISRSEDFDSQEYNRIFETVRKAGVIADDGRIIEKNENNALNKIISVDNY
jgi:large-conductance mechanosensitive channel